MGTPHDGVAVVGATVIDGRGGTLPNATVVARGGRLETIRQGASAPDGARVIDGRGRWIIPGLIDMHVHINMAGEDALPAWLSRGITSVRDTGGGLGQLLPLRADLAAGRRVGPRLFCTGPMIDGLPGTWYDMPEAPESEDGSLPMSVAFGDPAQIERFARRLIDAGVDALKAYASLSPEGLDAVLRAAEGRVPVTSHLWRLDAAEAVEHGLRNIEHLVFSFYGDVLGPDTVRVRPGDPAFWEHCHTAWAGADLGSPRIRRVVDAIGGAGVVLDPTLVVEAGPWGNHEAEQENELRFNTATQQGTWQSEAGELLRGGTTRHLNPALMLRSMEQQFALLGLLAEAGVRIVAGTDTGGVYPLAPGYALHRELAWLVRAGLSPQQALAAGTSAAAQALGQADRLGALAEGMQADFLVLSADPLQRIENTQQIELIVAGGQVFEPRELAAMAGVAPA